MKTYRTPVVMGLVLALLLGAAGLAGYGVVVYYNWLILLFALLSLAAPTVKRQPGEELLFEDCTPRFTGKSISPTGNAPILETLFPYTQ